MLVLGAIAVIVRQFGSVLELPVFDSISLVIILVAALLVSGAVTYTAVRTLRSNAADRPLYHR